MVEDRKAQVRERIQELLTIPTDELLRDADGCAEGLLPTQANGRSALRKFSDEGLWFVHAGGSAGMFSAIIGGWSGGPSGSRPVTREVRW